MFEFRLFIFIGVQWGTVAILYSTVEDF